MALEDNPTHALVSIKLQRLYVVQRTLADVWGGVSVSIE
jgi:hypothetical protein